MKLHTNVMSYGGKGALVSLPAAANASVVKPVSKAEAQHHQCACGCLSGTREEQTNSVVTSGGTENGAPDFANMTPAQKIAFHKARWDRILG
jgi:hypothetical protein